VKSFKEKGLTSLFFSTRGREMEMARPKPLRVDGNETQFKRKKTSGVPTSEAKFNFNKRGTHFN
jgi:hypothetical protein